MTLPREPALGPTSTSVESDNLLSDSISIAEIDYAVKSLNTASIVVGPHHRLAIRVIGLTMTFAAIAGVVMLSGVFELRFPYLVKLLGQQQADIVVHASFWICFAVNFLGTRMAVLRSGVVGMSGLEARHATGLLTTSDILRLALYGHSLADKAVRSRGRTRRRYIRMAAEYLDCPVFQRLCSKGPLYPRQKSASVELVADEYLALRLTKPPVPNIFASCWRHLSDLADLAQANADHSSALADASRLWCKSMYKLYRAEMERSDTLTDSSIEISRQCLAKMELYVKEIPAEMLNLSSPKSRRIHWPLAICVAASIGLVIACILVYALELDTAPGTAFATAGVLASIWIGVWSRYSSSDTSANVRL